MVGKVLNILLIKELKVQKSKDLKY